MNRRWKWLVWLVAIPLAAVLIVPSVETLYRSQQPVPVPEESWDLNGTDIAVVEVPKGWEPEGGAWQPNTTYIPNLDVVLPFKDTGQRDGWLVIEKNVIKSGVRFNGAGTFTQGSMVIAAHVNNSKLGEGPFAKLVDIKPGMEIIVTDENAVPHRYKASLLESYNKYRLPDNLWAKEGPPVVTLITCGGKLARGEDGRFHYESNVVVQGDPIVQL